MTPEILIEQERINSDSIPEDISQEDLFKYFTLSDSDVLEIQECRGADNMIGFAIQLCALRMLGTFITDFSSVPQKVINFIASQLNLPLVLFVDYPKRRATRWEHQEHIREYLSFRSFDSTQQEKLADFLLFEALQCDSGAFLIDLAYQKLRRERIIRPGATTIERLVASIQNQAQDKVFGLILEQLSSCQKTFFNSILTVPEGKTYSLFQELKEAPQQASPNAFKKLIQRISLLRENGINELSFSEVNPNKVKYLARLANYYSTSPMQRFADEKRYALMACFLRETLIETIDATIDMYDALIRGVFRRSKNDLANLTQKIAKDVNEVILLFGDIGGVLLSEDVLSQDIRSTIYSQVISKEQLQQKVDFCELLARPRDYNCLDFVETRFNYTRQFSPHFLESFTFRSLKEEDELIDALQLIKQCNDENKRKIPTSVPTNFISQSWMEQMKKEDGTLDKHYYELCILTSLKDALRSGDIWVEGSRRYTDIKNYLFDDDHWEANKEKYYEQLNLPQDPRKFLSNLEQFFLELSTQVDDNFPTNPWAEIVDGELKVKRVEVVEIPDEVEQVKKLITSALPRVKLPDLLIEVDQWTHFTRHFTYFSGQESRTKDLQKCLFANFIGQGCNIGLVNMADSTPDITYRQLFHVSQWYLRDDTLRKAIAEIINFQHRLPVASVWGKGTKSSSDGKRISVPVNIFGAEFHPKYFGQYGRGVTLYSFLSDQFTEYYLKIILCNMREAAYVLDGLLNNETDLNPQEHFTDEDGYTENVFALASLLGYKFCPRFKDLAEQKIYKLNKEQVYSSIDPLFRDKKTNRVFVINTSLIIEQWDNIVRLVASLKNRIVSASLLLGKMGSYRRTSRLLRAIIEIGRIFKTLFILEYLDNPSLRSKEQLYLSRHESKNALADYLFFGDEGELRRRDYESQMERMSCLSLLINCIVAWNTYYIGKIVEQLRKGGHKITDDILFHISPLMHRHINPYGVYYFNIP